MAGLKLLITSGATREPIDGVRFISNVSTGRTGAALADFFSSAGFDVTYLHGEGAALPLRSCQAARFTDFADLDAKLRTTLAEGRYFAVIMAAAVSDYSVSRVESGAKSFGRGEVRKIDSGEELVIRLSRNPKLVSRLREYSGGQASVVAFKLTNGADEAERSSAISKLVAGSDVDLLVHNDLLQMKGAGRLEHEFTLYRNASGAPVAYGPTVRGVEDLGTLLVQFWKEKRL